MVYDVLVNGRTYDSFEADSTDDFYWEDFVEEHEDELRAFDDPDEVHMFLLDEDGNSYYHTFLGDYIEVYDDDDDDDEDDENDEDDEDDDDDWW